MYIIEHEISQALSFEDLLDENLTPDDQAASSKPGISTAEKSVKGLTVRWTPVQSQAVLLRTLHLN